MDDKDIYINSKFKEYKESDNKKAFLADLLLEAYKEPDTSWSIWAPTKKLAYEFELVETKIEADKSHRNFNKEQNSLQTTVDMCILTSKPMINGKLDPAKLKIWEDKFKDVQPDFLQLVYARQQQLEENSKNSSKNKM